MRVPVATGGHDKPLVGVIDNFGLAVFDESFGSFLVADVDEFAVLNRERLVLSSEVKILP